MSMSLDQSSQQALIMIQQHLCFGTAVKLPVARISTDLHLKFKAIQILTQSISQLHCYTTVLFTLQLDLILNGLKETFKPNYSFISTNNVQKNRP
jgi:hypothetical protein